GVEEFKLTPRPSNTVLYSVGGHVMDRFVTVPTVIMGAIRGQGWRFIVEADGLSPPDSDVVGTLGPDIFSQFDVELDYAAKKLNLFSPDHCEGRVIYWQPKALAVIPMQVVSGHVVVPVTVDGHRLKAAVDTGAALTIMNAARARSNFGLDENS